MNVLHVIDTLERGGSEVLLLDVCQTFERETSAGLVVCASGGGILEEQFAQAPCTLIRHNRTSAIDISLLRRIRSIVKEYNITVIHGHQPVSTLHALIATVGLSIPVVHTIHGIAIDKKNIRTLRLIVHYTTANILVSPALNGLLKVHNHLETIPNSVVLYNGVNPNKLAKIEKATLREELHLDKGDILIGMVSNIMPGKDYQTLCKSVVILRKKYPQLHCVIVGRIDDMQSYKECQEIIKQGNIHDAVHFVGARDDVPAILQSLDVFVFSTLADTFGLALVEAMMSKVLCVVSNTNAMNDVTNNGSVAQLFDVGSAQHCADTIESVLIMSANQKQLRIEQAYSYAMNTYSIKQHCYKLAELYKRLV